MKILIPSKVAEIMFGLIIGMFGVFHFINVDSMLGAIPAFMPGSKDIWVYVSGAFLLLVAISIITGKQKMFASYLLAVMLLVIALSVHLKSLMDGSEQAMGQILKDVAMAMGAILIANRSDK